MFWIIKKFFTKRSGKKEYGKKLIDFLSDWKLDKAEKSELKKIAKEYDLNEKDLLSFHKKACSHKLSDISSDGKITEVEKKSLEELMKYFKLSTDDYDFNQGTFNKFYTLGLIEKWVLPTASHNLNVIFKKWEVLHWWNWAELKKHKKKTTRVNFWWLTWSIKIAKGVRYRVWSLWVSTHSTEYLVTEDEWTLWLSNMRIWFAWTRKQFTIPYNKVLSFNLTEEWLYIYKDGRENPFIIQMDDYEVTCAICSFMLNQE